LLEEMGAEVRKERIAKIGRIVQKNLYDYGKLSLSKTGASLQYEFGFAKDKLIEYINILAQLGRFTLDKDKDRIRKVSETVES